MNFFSLVAGKIIAESSSGNNGGTDTRLKDIVERTLTELVDDTITKIGKSVFYNATTITKLDLPNCINVEAEGIGKASYLTTISLPKLETIGNSGMCDCVRLNEIDFPSLVETKQNAFSGCTALTKAVLSNIVTVGNSSFYNCNLLAYCDLGANVTSIGTSVFYKNSKLKTLIIRNTNVVPTIQSNTFSSSAIASGTGFVYVPDTLVDSYKVADKWSTYANQIKGLSELSQ